MVVVRSEKGEELIRDLIINRYINKFTPKKSTISEWKSNKINFLRKMTNMKINKYHEV